jgi:hypothetical protein
MQNRPLNRLSTHANQVGMAGIGAIRDSKFSTTAVENISGREELVFLLIGV